LIGYVPNTLYMTDNVKGSLSKYIIE
jgi:hypothetical protein